MGRRPPPGVIGLPLMAEPTPLFTLTEIRSVSARLEPYDWPWARENAEAIDRNWERRRAERPGMFDGVVLLCRSCEIRHGDCEVVFFEARYRRFVAFRDAGSPDPGVFNAFAAIAPHTADGAVLLGEMASHTANAGQVYFPCGTPDLDDLRADGVIDLTGSAAREFQEETGLALPAGEQNAPWILARGDGQLAFLHAIRFAEDAAILLARIAEHHAGEPEPELARMVVARTRADIDTVRMQGFVRAYLTTVLPG